LIVFEKINNNGSFFLNWKFLNRREVYGVSISVCEDLFHDCRTIECGFDLPGQSPKKTSDRLSFDLEKRKIGSTKKLSASKYFFTATLIDQMQPNDWELLDYSYRALRREQTIAYNPQTGPLPQFNLASIETNRDRVWFNVVFKHADHETATFENREIFLDQAYCVHPNCQCTDLIMMFVPYVDEKMIKQSSYPIVEYDYRKKTFKDPTNFLQNELTPNTILNGFQAKYKNFDQIFSERHKQLKIMYQRYREDHRDQLPQTNSAKPALNPTLPKLPAAAPVYTGIGRNDPCPCGSGKKFKKCCGKNG
jgi:hypothetical protein